MDYLFRLIQRHCLVLGFLLILLSAVPDAFARSWVWGTPSGLFANSYCGKTCALSGAVSCLDTSMVCAAGGDMFYVGSYAWVKLDGGNPYLAGSNVPVPADKPYQGCLGGYFAGGEWHMQDCDAAFSVGYTGRTWAVCPVGDGETFWWKTTIASGSLLSGFTPTGTPPAQVCQDGCVIQGGSLSYGAKVRAGETAVGNDLWVQVNGQVTPSLCTESNLGGMVPAAALPPALCDPNSEDCAGGGAGSGSGSDLPPEFGQIAANTLGTRTALDKLRTSSDLSLSGSYDNCSELYTCSGDVLRCATLSSLRDEHCRNKPIDEVAAAAAEALGASMLSETAGEHRNTLKEGLATVNLGSGFGGARWLSAAACPAPVSFSVLGVSHEVGFQAFCQLASVFSFVLVAGAALVAGRVVAGGLV